MIEHAKGMIMIADILTKGQARAIFLQLTKRFDDYSKKSIIDLKTLVLSREMAVS